MGGSCKHAEAGSAGGATSCAFALRVIALISRPLAIAKMRWSSMEIPLPPHSARKPKSMVAYLGRRRAAFWHAFEQSADRFWPPAARCRQDRRPETSHDPEPSSVTVSYRESK